MTHPHDRAGLSADEAAAAETPGVLPLGHVEAANLMVEESPGATATVIAHKLLEFEFATSGTPQGDEETVD